MEAGMSLISSPLRTHIRHCSTSFCSSSLVRCTPTLVLTQERRDETRAILSSKEETSFERILENRLVAASLVSSPDDKNNRVGSNQYSDELQYQMLLKPELWYLWSSLHGKEQIIIPSSESVSDQSERSKNIEAEHVIALAREALSASQEAATKFKEAKLLEGSSISRGLDHISQPRFVRSTRRLERQNKKRLPKPKIEVQESNYHNKLESNRRLVEGYDQNDPLRLFLWGPETRQLLTANEESELIIMIQELTKLHEVRNRLQTQTSREPTLIEWADALGITCQALQSKLNSGKISRDKLIYANLRMVVHIAKQYQGRGLSLQDLLQEGSMGLMRSVEKFKPQVGCRFATYAYWWIRQSIRKALFQHSRTIRLPENVYALLSKVYEAKKSCFQQGNHRPMKEDIAACAGMSVQKLESLLFTARTPLSMQQPVWMDQDTTYQEITADTSMETPDVSVSKQLMRQHVRNLLGVLNPRERKIIRLRFGIGCAKEKSLSEIGAGLGLSKERVRQLESRALYKLKQCLGSQGLSAYSDMLI